MIHKIRWTAEKIAQRLALIEPLVYREQAPLPPFQFTALPGPEDDPPIGEYPLVEDTDTSGWQVIEPHSYWGSFMTDFHLRSTFQIPADWNADAPVALHLPLGEPVGQFDFSHPECLAYIDGESYAASDRHHHEILLSNDWRDGLPHRLDLHGWTGLGGFGGVEPGMKLYMRPCAVVLIDQPTRDFIATARIALGIVQVLDENNPAKGHLLNALNDAFKVLETREPLGKAFYASVEPAHEALRAGIDKAGPSMEVDIAAAGHAHIDVAWLWTLAQTRRKAGRTFHTVLRLMEQFPDYRFSQSQPQLYDYIQQDYPQLMEGIKARVAEGRWEPLGGMWVEADCNLTGAESLARQFLLGRTYFRDTFGPDAESPVLWLPDVFGYAWALPQLIKQAGLEYFFTIKIDWNQYNRMPFESFWWQGLDGTKVLTHFSPTPGMSEMGDNLTYNAEAIPAEAIATWNNFQQKESQQELLTVFGHGDGGGGPTRQMLENIREMADFPATPRYRHESVGNFFRKMEEQSGDKLPTWNAELYLEYHRGTYTTQSRGKRGNRKSEFLLHDAEFLASLATQLDSEYDYPKATLNKAWELVCLNQFHDIIPGSSIYPVHAEALGQYAEVQSMGEGVRDAALASIAAQTGTELLLVNPTSFVRDDLAFWPGQLAEGQRLQRTDGTPLAVQSSSEGTWIETGELPPYSVTGLAIQEESAPSLATDITATPTLLENRILRVELDETGDIVRLYDKVNDREVLAEGAVANQFQAFEDRPKFFDAWDIDIYYDDKMWTADPATSVTVVEAGPLRATLAIKRRILNSEYTQTISLSHDSAQLDFDTVIDWHEQHVLLKAAFPVDVLAPAATFEIQWGSVERPTHRNTSWDWARFETCAQKWIDLSEGGYGVSLLNDCKYGHDVSGNVMRISLLRSPTMPDPVADQGEHRFAYSLLPHTGGWDERTIGAAYGLNDPLLVWQSPGAAQPGANEDGRALESPFLAVDQPHIVLETIKQAEDGNGLIVRLYDSQRRRGKVTLTTAFDLAAAWTTNLIEDDQEAISTNGNSVDLYFKPFEIKTLRLIPASEG